MKKKEEEEGTSSNSALKITLAAVGAGLVGAAIGAIAGIFGSKASSDKREAEILSLRQKSQATSSTTSSNQLEKKHSDLFTQIDSFHCPITQEIMKEPVIITKCSHSF